MLIFKWHRWGRQERQRALVFGWVPELAGRGFGSRMLGLCHQKTGEWRSCPLASDTRNWHSNRLLAMFLRGICGLLGRVRKVSRWMALLLGSPIPSSTLFCDLLHSTQTGSRCLKCLRDFVNVSMSSPPSVWCLLQLNALENVHSTCQ